MVLVRTWFRRRTTAHESTSGDTSNTPSPEVIARNVAQLTSLLKLLAWSINPGGPFESARPSVSKHHVALLSDAIAQLAELGDRPEHPHALRVLLAGLNAARHVVNDLREHTRRTPPASQEEGSAAALSLLAQDLCAKFDEFERALPGRFRGRR